MGEVENLRKNIKELEKKLAEKQINIEDEKLGSAPVPKVLQSPDYDYVEGWKMIDLKIMNEALEIAQKCGHSQIVLVEVNRTKVREGLASHLAYVCIACGRQTIFPTSSFSHEDPPNYEVNKQFSALGMATYNSMVTLVQNDKATITVPKDQKMLDSKPTFWFTYENLEDESTDRETEHVAIDCTPDIKKEPFVKVEPEDYMEDFLEPSISLTEEEPSNYNNEVGLNIKEESEGVDPTENSEDPQIDVRTITTNTPLLALSTVKPNTEVMGGYVTPWAPNRLVKCQPSLFIRTTCSKIMLPPGLYRYKRNNGLQSFMSVRADSGTFDSIESHYLLMDRPTKFYNEKPQGKKVDNRRANTVVRKTYTSAHRKTGLQIFSEEVKKDLRAELVDKDDWSKETIDRWANLDPVLKKEYNDRALNPHGKSPEPEPQTSTKKKSTNIPLPALKKFASEFAPGLKKNKPYLAKPENRGQLNKLLIEMWMALSPGEQMSYKLLAGMSVEETPRSEDTPNSESQPLPSTSQRKGKIKIKKPDSDSDTEYTPRPSKRRR